MSSVSSYRSLLRLPGVKSLLVLSLLVRGINIPIGAIITVISFEISGSWVDAALAGGIAAGASALAMWMSGKAMDIWSPRLLLLLFIPGGFVPLLFLTNPEGTALFLTALLLGLTRPPSGTTIRTAWTRLVHRDQERLLAYGLDASIVPIAGALGAFLAGVFVSTLGNEALIIFLTIMASLSTVLLAFHPATEAKGVRKGFSWPELFRKKQEALPPLGLSIWTTISLVALSWGALVGLEILVGDKFGPDLLLFVTALGGFAVAVGALANNRARDRSGATSLVFSAILAAASLVLITLALFTEPLLAFPAIISFGLARGVISASASTYLSITSPRERLSESLALYGSGVLVGQAVYRPLAGLLLVLAPVAILLLPAALFSLLALVFNKQKDKYLAS